MGAIMGKSKSVPISNGVTKTTARTNGISKLNGNLFQTGPKLKKPTTTKGKPSKGKVDQSTSTDCGFVPSPSVSCIRQLVSGSDVSGVPSKDVLDLRDACIRRGIISAECNVVRVSVASEGDHQQTQTVTVVEESVKEITLPTVTNMDSVDVEQQQQDNDEEQQQPRIDANLS